MVAVFKRAVHLETRSGDIISILPSGSDGPLAVTVRSTDEIPRAIGSRVLLTLGRSEMLQTQEETPVIELRTAREWTVRFRPSSWTSESLGSDLQVLTALTERSAFLANDQVGAALREARSDVLFRLGCGNRVGDAIEKLVGLGPGLTPSGDDWLIAFVAGFLHLSYGRAKYRMPRSELVAGVREVLNMRPTCTTAFSRTMIQQATDGAVSTELICTVRALGGRQRARLLASAACLETVGHSSGADMLMGLSDAAGFLAEMGD